MWNHNTPQLSSDGIKKEPEDQWFFSLKDFLQFFPIIVYVKKVIPGAGPFLTSGYNVNNLGKGPLDKTKH